MILLVLSMRKQVLQVRWNECSCSYSYTKDSADIECHRNLLYHVLEATKTRLQLLNLYSRGHPFENLDANIRRRRMAFETHDGGQSGG